MITALSISTGGLGRAGNQMFTIAGVIGIARKSGQPFAFPKWVNHDNKLFGGEADEMSQFFVNPLPKLPEGLSFQEYPYFWEYRDVILPTGNWNIFAHLQSVKFFDHCIDEVRHYFTMKDELEQNDYVAIHYRAGDYIDDQRAYHPRCSIKYYLQAINLFPSDAKFILFSDDINSIEKLRHNGDLFTRIKLARDVDYIEDFKIMKSCKSFITANSSFSHMAALLGTHPEKKIVMPKLWFGEQAGGLNFDSLYPPEAIII